MTPLCVRVIYWVAHTFSVFKSWIHFWYGSSQIDPAENIPFEPECQNVTELQQGFWPCICNRCASPKRRLHNCTKLQDCQMVCFQTQNPNLGKFWRILQCKRMVYFMDSRSILWSFVIFYGHLVKFVVIWYIFPRFSIL
jgi:hypothetical protein